MYSIYRSDGTGSRGIGRDGGRGVERLQARRATSEANIQYLVQSKKSADAVEI
jgi:hypothetical protein